MARISPASVSTRAPAWDIAVGDHLAPPQARRSSISVAGIELQRQAAANAAAIEGQHQARGLLAAAEAVDDEAEAPVIAAQQAAAEIGMA